MGNCEGETCSMGKPLTCTKEWKNASPKTIFRHALSLVLDSKNSVSDRGSEVHVRCKPAFKPEGASLVILTEFSKIPTGKVGLG